MAETTAIEWTDATWNPVTGCTLVSEGCRHCYAARLAATRLRDHPSRAGLARINAAGEAKFTGKVRLNGGWLDQPLRWRRPRRIFVCAHGDLFHEAVPDDWIDRVFAVMVESRRHVFQVLTKRPARMRAYVSGWLERGRPLPGPLPNLWLGVSVEDQPTADARIPDLLATPAALRFVSAEPLLGPVDLTQFPRDDALLGYAPDETGDRHRIDWVIAGGESGPGARPMHPDWARGLRDQCEAARVPFFFKQWGEHSWCEAAEGDPRTLTAYRLGKRAAGWRLDGREHREFPR